MGGGPGFFSDFGTKAQDLLLKDYVSGHKLSVSVYNDARSRVRPSCSMGLTTTTSRTGGCTVCDVASLLKYNNVTLDVNVDTNSNVSATLRGIGLHPWLKTNTTFVAHQLRSSIASTNFNRLETFLLLKCPDYESGKLGFQYSHHHAAVYADVGMNKKIPIDLSITLGTPTFAFGAQATCMGTSGLIEEYSAGLRIRHVNSHFSMILADKCDLVKASFVYCKAGLNNTGVALEFARKLSGNMNLITARCCVRLRDSLALKVKLDSHGILDISMLHDTNKKTSLILSSQFASGKAPKFGMSVALKHVRGLTS